jgi:hypothetical protein
MLGALEGKTSPRDMRRQAATRLSQEPTNLDFHKALLRLARLRRVPGLRLVTTNFDLLFEKAQENLRLGHDYHSGPVLPIPRNDKSASWRSIVYLHGRLEPVDGDNSHLVLTSADFGHAYLTDAWAARFVARLFSDFTVLFVGYSLNDPVLRYMTDAFAAEDARARGGTPRGPAYIFVPHLRTPPDAQPYRDRKLEPIFYHQTHRHVRLKKTLVEWARAREDYLSNTGVMIGRIARNPPEALDPSATDNLLWALFGRPEDHGYGARIFADLDPLPRLQWLAAFEQREADLRSMHAVEVAAAEVGERSPPPEPVYHVGQLFPHSSEGDGQRLTEVGKALSHWLTRHLEAVELVDWTIGKLREGRRPHPELRSDIRRRLAEGPPPAEGFRRFWRIVCSEGGWALAAPVPRFGFWDLEDSIATERDEAWAVQELAGILTPRLTFNRSLHRLWQTERDAEGGAKVEGAKLAEIADADVSLAGEESLARVLGAIDRTEAPDAFWATQLEMLTRQLRQVFALFAAAGEADRENDPSALHRPSIAPHEQNRHNSSWTRLFDLIWRGFTHLNSTDAAATRLQVWAWHQIPFLGFRRLALAAMQHSEHFSAEEKLQALLDD